MEKNYFIQLLRKYFTSDLTKEERSYLDRYYDLFENEPDVLGKFNPEERMKLRDELKLAIDQSIAEEIVPVAAKKVFPLRYKIIAAAAVVLFFLTAGVVYKYEGSSKKAVVAMVTTLTEERREILLADGSKVTLYPGSKLQYPPSFSKEGTREIFLEGEAFFDVAHNEEMPFIVHTGKLETKVLGTAFLIKALAGSDDITVTVNRGKVKVCDQHRVLGIIVRDEQIVYNKQAEVFVQNTVNSDNLLDLASQELKMDDLTVAEAAVLLQERFGVKIEINDKSVAPKRFTASFPGSVSLEEALENICEFNDAFYQYDSLHQKIIIRKNQ